jgi:hypothetical protein
LLTPLRRDLFVSDVGPDASGSKPGSEGCHHTPEKSGMDAAPSAGPAAGASVCPKADVAAAAAKIINRRSFRRFPIIISSVHAVITLPFDGLGYFGGAGSSIASSGARTVKNVMESTNRPISGVS